MIVIIIILRLPQAGRNENFWRSGRSQGISFKVGKLFDIVKAASEKSGNLLSDVLRTKSSQKWKEFENYEKKLSMACKKS